MTASWIQKAKEMGFDEACALNVETLRPMDMVRQMCAADKCGAYGKNWTCPPACGTLEDCAKRMRQYRHGILLQSVGKLNRRIDTRTMKETEQRHNDLLQIFAQELRREYPDALCLGAGGCRLCKECAYPEPCRFPEKAFSGMEAYGLFVTQVCRDNGAAYYHGPQTITFSACVLF